MKTVEFTKKHNYGGVPFEPDDRLECPDDRAALLIQAGVAKEVSGRDAGEDLAGNGKRNFTPKTSPSASGEKPSKRD